MENFAIFTILPSPPRWLSTTTRLSVFRCCSMVAKHGPITDTHQGPCGFHIRCLQTILGVRWWQKVSHVELFSKANITPVEHLLVQRQLRWLGYVIRLPDNRLPRHLLYGELSQGQRSFGRPKKRFSDYIKITLQKCNIQLSDLEASASDRDVWRTVCEADLNNFMNDWINISMKRRAARHASTAKSKTGPRCPQCSRLCASDFGIRAIFDPTHLLERTTLSSATSSSIPTDFSSSILIKS